jgi:UDP-glucose 4-epimerase
MAGNMTHLATDGTGYIGSNTVVELMAAGRDVFVIENICNSKASVSNWGLHDIKDGD